MCLVGIGETIVHAIDMVCATISIDGIKWDDVVIVVNDKQIPYDVVVDKTYTEWDNVVFIKYDNKLAFCDRNTRFNSTAVKYSSDVKDLY